MQDETITTSGSEQHSANHIKHSYYETGRELLAKPGLLCDLMEIESGSPALVYCNTPSDTDFVEIMLRKRGISAQKLIGNVPQPKLEKTMEQVKSGEITVVVLTDIAARNIDMSLFGVAINYSVPADSDTYLDRAGNKKPGGLKSVISLITPLDLANFHYVKKGAGVEIVKADDISPELLLKARISSLKNQAEKEPALKDESLAKLVSLISEDAGFRTILTLLVHNTFTVLPALKSSTAKNESYDDEDDFELDQRDSRDSRDSRGDSRGEGRGGRGRGGRGGDRYDSYSRNPNGNVDPENRSRYSGDHDEEPRGERRGGQRRGGDRDRGERGERREQRNRRQHDSGPARKDGRVYIGIGAEQDFSRDKLVDILTEKCGMSEADLKHFSLRKKCSFADLDDDKCQALIDTLSATEIGGDKVYAVKAITINSQNPAQDQEGAEQDRGSDFPDTETFDGIDTHDHEERNADFE